MVTANYPRSHFAKSLQRRFVSDSQQMMAFKTVFARTAGHPQLSDSSLASDAESASDQNANCVFPWGGACHFKQAQFLILQSP